MTLARTLPIRRMKPAHLTLCDSDIPDRLFHIRASFTVRLSRFHHLRQFPVKLSDQRGSVNVREQSVTVI